MKNLDIILLGMKTIKETLEVGWLRFKVTSRLTDNFHVFDNCFYDESECCRFDKNRY